MHCGFPAIILAFCGALVGCSHLSPAQKAVLTESKEARDARMQWWRDARFGMFIHWGIYAVPAGLKPGPVWYVNKSILPSLVSQGGPKIRRQGRPPVILSKRAGLSADV